MLVFTSKIKHNKLNALLHELTCFLTCRNSQVSMPSSNVVVLTDPDSTFLLDRNNAIKLPIEGDYSRSNLMLQRIKSYIVSTSFSLFSLPPHLFVCQISFNKFLLFFLFNNEIGLCYDLVYCLPLELHYLIWFLNLLSCT